MTTQDDDKALAARAAAAEVKDGMLVGLGTGSTAAHLIEELGRRVAQGLRIEATATSEASDALARQVGIPTHPFDALARVDLTIDGADEIDPELRAIKGAGGAMLREKVVATAAVRMVVIADGTKRVERLGKAPVPVEVLPFAYHFVDARLRALGADPVLRLKQGEPYRTDQANLVLDCRFGTLSDPTQLAAALAAIPGLLGHGLFLTQVDAAYIASGGQVVVLERSAPRGG
jgi:ribose 5-phosphate isomerase A